jgi:hypothetical protein
VHVCPVGQRLPHARQFCGSVWVFVQTVAAPEPQSTFGDAQVQAELVQVSPAKQEVVHEPQW